MSVSSDNAYQLLAFAEVTRDAAAVTSFYLLTVLLKPHRSNAGAAK
jgi:hypothetical protein